MSQGVAIEGSLSVRTVFGDDSSMDTGGYTGAWGNSGKLAVLHEKELVLNKSDTENILSAVVATRQLKTDMLS
jgi:hypothetical protein